MKKTVFLDRDGTINHDSGYLDSPDLVTLIDGAAEAIKLMMPYYKIIVVSNQSGIARGFFTKEKAELVFARVRELLADEGAVYDAEYYCPHGKEDDCLCRKPRPGMVFKSTYDHMLNLDNPWMVGDRSSDIELGKAIAAKTILLPESEDAPKLKMEPDYRCDSLLDAAKLILKCDGI